MKRLFFILIVGLLNHPVWAIDNSCLDNAATQRALNYCADSVRLQATQLLREMMGELNLRNELSIDDKDKLAQIHQVWYESVDLDCKWIANAHKGSTQFPYIIHNCWTQRIMQRVEWLAPKLCPKGQTECMHARRFLDALPYRLQY